MNICFYLWFDSLCQQFFSHVGTGLPGLNQCLAGGEVPCSRTQHSDSAGREAQTSNPAMPSLT